MTNSTNSTPTSWPLPSSTLFTTLALAITTIAAHHHYKTTQQRKRLGNFPSSSPWFLPFADLLRLIRAGTFEQFITRRKIALKSDAFYIHILGLTRRPTLVLTEPRDHTELMKKEAKLQLSVDMPETTNETHGPGNLQALSGSRHNFLRKIFLSLLHPAALELFVPYFYEEFTNMWTELEENGGVVIIQDAICEAQFFLMAKILYGMTLENTSMNEMNQLRQDFELQLKGHFASPKSETFKKAKEASIRVRQILNPKFDIILEKRRKILETSQGKNGGCDEAFALLPVGNAMESIADALLKDHVDSDPQILSDVYDNLNLLLEASHGTTMTVTTSALYYLNHPDNITKLQKLREEVKAFGHELPTVSNLKNDMPLTDGIINETMRLAPIVGNVFYACKDDITFTFKEQQMQGPITFMLPFAHNYSDPQYYSNPNCFVPERWIAGAPEEVSEKGRAAFKPFGMGRHLCLGYNLATLVMKSALYCFARDDTRVIEFDTVNVKPKADVFPAYSISNGFPGRVVVEKC